LADVAVRVLALVRAALARAGALLARRTARLVVVDAFFLAEEALLVAAEAFIRPGAFTPALPARAGDAFALARLAPAREPRCEAGISALATAFVKRGISFSR
jgi:hypothetical protein